MAHDTLSGAVTLIGGRFPVQFGTTQLKRRNDMFIAMNRFQVRKGAEEDFERLWKERDTRLADVPGVAEFRMLRGPQKEDYTLYASHTVWETHQAFEDWTHSEAFRSAHHGAGEHKWMYLEGPHFEGFKVVQHLEFSGSAPQ